MSRHLISMLDLGERTRTILDLAARIKESPADHRSALASKSLGMIFEKPSTRTRVSFEVAMVQLGGHALNLSPKDLQIGRGETTADTAKVLSRYLDGIMYRAFSNEMMRELAANSSVPVISGLDDREHPCQIVGDLLTVREHCGKLGGLTLAYVGDGNNVCNSLMLGCALAGVNFVGACPEGFDPDGELFAKAEALAARGRARMAIVRDPLKAVRGADVIYTDVWVSMGDEKEAAEREQVFAPYQVNQSLMDVAPHALFMHCLPAHRGYEVTDEVIDSDRSIVWDQAENRLHAQKAILVDLLGEGEVATQVGPAPVVAPPKAAKKKKAPKRRGK
ncbi:MAG TPA: ornithine carbamoyltransferase [Thermoplasmata archaeon]|nr:ornithine carbamoyltransferase [Thermoplasmata archaeon]